MDEQKSKEAFSQMSFNQKLSHIWFYYKWMIICAAVVLVMIVTCFVQCASKDTVDAMVMYIGDHYLPIEYVRSLNASLENVMSNDFNNDGKKTVDFLQIRLDMYTPDGYGSGGKKEIYKPSEQVETLQRIEVETATGQSVIYVLEPTLYESYKHVLAPLKDVLGYTPENAVDDYGIKVSSLEVYQDTYLSYLPKDSIICIRAERTEGNMFTKKDSPAYYASNAEFFKELIEYKSEN